MHASQIVSKKGPWTCPKRTFAPPAAMLALVSMASAAALVPQAPSLMAPQQAPAGLRIFVLPLSERWNVNLLACPSPRERWHSQPFVDLLDNTTSRNQVGYRGPLDYEYDFESWMYATMLRSDALTTDIGEADFNALFS